jgi:hypothetical protein
MSTFNFVADTHAASAEDTTIGIKSKQFMRGINFPIWEAVGQRYVINAKILGSAL